ncbi:MAG: cysteine-rich CWC family protein [Gemmatimonadaceae bacterium]
MTVEFIDPAICPLCAERNDCAMVDGGKTCWCFTASIPRETLERIPVEQRGLACICRKCGGAFNRD